VRQNKLSL